MPEIIEGGLRFSFPDSWTASKFDMWSFYRNQFQKVCSSKAVDIVAICDRICFCIEAKDYRRHRRTKVSNIADEVAQKVRDSLAAVFVASLNADVQEEKRLARDVLRCSRLRVVLHLEQPRKHSKLFPRAISTANVMQRLKQLVKAIDPHPLVLEMSDMHNVDWSVS